MIVTKENDHSTLRAPLGAGHVSLRTLANRDKAKGNEDALGFFQIGTKTTLLVLADGMGGMPDGEEASKAVLDAFQNAKEDVQNTVDVLAVLSHANQTIMSKWPDAGTTAVVAEMGERGMRFYWVGDSAGMVVDKAGKIDFQTQPHSVAGYMDTLDLDPGHVPDLDDQTHALIKHVGDPKMTVEVSAPIKLRKTDTVFLASDGITDFLPVEFIAKTVSKGSVKAIVHQLDTQTEAISEAWGMRDDRSYILYRNR